MQDIKNATFFKDRQAAIGPGIAFRFSDNTGYYFGIGWDKKEKYVYGNRFESKQLYQTLSKLGLIKN